MVVDTNAVRGSREGTTGEDVSSTRAYPRARKALPVEVNKQFAAPIEHTAAMRQSVAPLVPGDLVTEREAAGIINAAVQTLRNWRYRGEGPRWIRIGRRLIRYRRADLAAFIAGQVGQEAA